MQSDDRIEDQSALGEPPGAVMEEDGRRPIYNERGIIAENYYDLQGLGVLAAARQAYPLPPASAESTLRAVFQAVEIALVNLADITARAAADLEHEAIGTAVVKAFWARGFHRLLVRLSMMPHQLGLIYDTAGPAGVLRIRESPAFGDYLQALSRFDRSVARSIESDNLPIETALAERSLESAEFNLIHLARICNHESTIWEHNLVEIRVPAAVPSYQQFVATERMRDAVYDRVLTGDTYFTQFRGLHQIPETLGEEVNDHSEQAIRDIRSNRLREAIDHLRCANILVEGMLMSLPPMADNLATSDYHQIRENLGLTSGSHSVCLRFHMFTDLYRQLWEEIAHHLTGLPAQEASETAVEEAIRQVDRRRFDDPRAWMMHLLLNHCLTLRTFIFQWRDQHLHMPRNNLGGDFTKSLTGSPDAITTVKKMRNVARARDPMLPLARVRGLAGARGEAPIGQLAGYLESEVSLDSRILVTTGHVTQGRFQEVQERLGFFANRCPFSPPPTRTV